MKNYSKLLKQIVFFGFVGGVTLLIDLTVTTTLYSLLHLPASLAATIGFLSGFFFNFPMNRKRVFHHESADRFSMATQITLYVCLSLFNLGMTGILTHLLVDGASVNIAVAKVGITALIAIWNFLCFKLLIFSKRSADA